MKDMVMAMKFSDRLDLLTVELVVVIMHPGFESGKGDGGGLPLSPS
jgi:hypothetical protein